MLAAAAFGLAFGFVGSVPIAGPVSALVFRCGIDGRFSRGRGIAIGAAVAEAVYAFLAFWGFSTVLAQYQFVLPLSRLVGGVILMALGLAFVSRPASSLRMPAAPEERVGSASRSFFVGFGITGLNPTLIATWTAVVATLYSTELATFTTPTAGAFAIGVAVGIASWFVLLLALLRRFRERFEKRMLDRAVRAIGVILFGLGVYFLLTLIPGVGGF
jgi:threonine/homoserine/homoserine lactone efflux protein